MFWYLQSGPPSTGCLLKLRNDEAHWEQHLKPVNEELRATAFTSELRLAKRDDKPLSLPAVMPPLSQQGSSLITDPFAPWSFLSFFLSRPPFFYVTVLRNNWNWTANKHLEPWPKWPDRFLAPGGNFSCRCAIGRNVSQLGLSSHLGIMRPVSGNNLRKNPNFLFVCVVPALIRTLRLAGKLLFVTL